MKLHYHLISVGDGSDYRGINKVHIHSQSVRDILNSIEYNLIGEIRKTCDRVVYPETTIITEWSIGGLQTPHLDTYSNPDIENDNDPDNPDREWTCILNLNDDYRDGRTYFPVSPHMPELDIVEPEVGSGLLFQGIHHLHGVETVRGCSRFTIAFWFTSNINKIMVDIPSKDLQQNHVQLRQNSK